MNTSDDLETPLTAAQLAAMREYYHPLTGYLSTGFAHSGLQHARDAWRLLLLVEKQRAVVRAARAEREIGDASLDLCAALDALGGEE